jgi:hypothetical protein
MHYRLSRYYLMHSDHDYAVENSKTIPDSCQKNQAAGNNVSMTMRCRNRLSLRKSQVTGLSRAASLKTSRHDVSLKKLLEILLKHEFIPDKNLQSE